MRPADRYLADAYAAHQHGDLARAADLYSRVLDTHPDDADALNLLGLVQLQRERPREALPYLRRADRAAPGNPETAYNLGLALMAIDDLRSARHSFEASHKLAPTNPEPLVAAANVARRLGARDSAREEYHDALGIDSNHRGARSGLAMVCNEDGIEANSSRKPLRALQLFREAVEFNDQYAEAWLNLGILEEQLGRLDEAAASLKTALRLDEDLVGAHFHLAHLKQHRSSPDEIGAMSTQFERGDLESNDRVTLAFGIAKAHEKLGEYDAEFDWLERAHRLQVREAGFDEQRDAKLFDRLRSTYGAGVFARFESQAGEGLVFVVGMPRSGTSLAEQILASHSDIHGAGELLAIANSQVSPGSSDQACQNAALEIEQRIREHAENAALAVETTPTNFLHLGRIALLFPAARIVYCTRDPRDTCVSIYQQPLSRAHGYAHDLGTLGRYYRRVQSLMDHWTGVVPNPLFELRYELLIESFETTVRELIGFCGVDFEDSCLHFHETSRQVRTPSASQVRQPIYASSVGRWKRYEDRLGMLLESLA